MKIRIVSLLCTFCFLGPIAAAALDNSGAAIKARLVLKVADRDAVADAIVQKARSDGGYFTSLDKHGVVVKIPRQKVTAFLEAVSVQGEVADRRIEREHLADVMMDNKSALAARENVKKQYLQVLEKSEAETIFSVEQEIINLVENIEELKGEIRMLEHRAAFALVDVAFEFRDRTPPLADGTSSFPWLNTVNLTDLLGDF